MLEETTSLYAFPTRNTVKIAHTWVKTGQTDGSASTYHFFKIISQISKWNEPEWVGTMGHSLQSEPNKSSLLSEHSMQQLPNSISKHMAPEAHQTDVSEQRHPPLRLVGRKKAIKEVTETETRANPTQLLSGWKEIANYMHQGVRTVQRWEAIGLPVRRVRATKPSPVIAFAEDLDVWARSLHVPLLDRIEELRATISSLEAQIRSLKRQLRMRNHPAHMDTFADSSRFSEAAS